MAKKGKTPDEIKQPRFKDRNLTMLDALKRDKNTVQNPFKRLGRDIFHPSPWLDDCVPNLLWAAIVVYELERDAALEVLRAVVKATIDHVKNRKELYVTHNYLAIANNEEFDTMMAPVLGSTALQKVMPALLFSTWLPDREHWARHFEPIDDDVSSAILMASVAVTHFHQSQEATDLRWFKMLSLIFAQERMVFNHSFEERLTEIAEYPDKGDMRSVRPFLRAMELGTRSIEFGLEPTVPWPKDRTPLAQYNSEPFWRELQDKTSCLVPSEFKRADIGPAEARREFQGIYSLLTAYFHATTVTTKADPRHEGAFGLVLYAFHLAMISAVTPVNSLAEGRIVLRTVLELMITLHYLTIKDDATIWLQYRKYGQGQSKLAFLKNVREEDIPEYIDLEQLEEFANEDRWMELEDIELGHWANLNLRKMAEEVGLKDLYDKFYDWSSGYVHGQWASARSTVFINCLNPLHRFHRIPGPIGQQFPSMLVDVSKLLNRMLDDVNSLYPAFKPRITWHKKPGSNRADDGKVDQPKPDDRVFKTEDVIADETKPS